MVEISYRIGNIERGRMRVFHASLIAFTFGAAIRALPELLGLKSGWQRHGALRRIDGECDKLP